MRIVNDTHLYNCIQSMLMCLIVWSFGCGDWRRGGLGPSPSTPPKHSPLELHDTPQSVFPIVRGDINLPTALSQLQSQILWSIIIDSYKAILNPIARSWLRSWDPMSASQISNSSAGLSWFRCIDLWPPFDPGAPYQGKSDDISGLPFWYWISTLVCVVLPCLYNTGTSLLSIRGISGPDLNNGEDRMNTI